MFPITHIWFSRRVLGYMNNMTVLGSVFPDTAIKCILTREDTHNVGWGLYRFIRDNKAEYLDFAKALATHTVDPKGLDFYGDEEYGTGYKGYCFQKAVEIEKEVIAACNIPEKFGLWKAHNFIEMGVEMNILNGEQGLMNSFYRGLTDNSLENELSALLDRYYGLEAGTTMECLERFTNFIELKDTSSLAYAKRYNRQMEAKHGININIPHCSDIIEKSRSIVTDDFDEFIGFCTEKVGTMLREGCE